MRARMAALQIACSAELSNTSHDNQGDNAQQHGSSSAGWALTRATVQSACRLQPEPCGAQQGSCRRRCARQRAAVRQRRSASSASQLLVHSAATPAPCAANVRTHPGSAWVSPLCSSCTASLLLARLLALPQQFSGLVARYSAQTRPPTHVLTDTGSAHILRAREPPLTSAAAAASALATPAAVPATLPTTAASAHATPAVEHVWPLLCTTTMRLRGALLWTEALPDVREGRERTPDSPLAAGYV